MWRELGVALLPKGDTPELDAAPETKRFLNHCCKRKGTMHSLPAPNKPDPLEAPELIRCKQQQ